MEMEKKEFNLDNGKLLHDDSMELRYELEIALVIHWKSEWKRAASEIGFGFVQWMRVDQLVQWNVNLSELVG